MRALISELVANETAANEGAFGILEHRVPTPEDAMEPIENDTDVVSDDDIYEDTNRSEDELDLMEEAPAACRLESKAVVAEQAVSKLEALLLSKGPRSFVCISSLLHRNMTQATATSRITPCHGNAILQQLHRE